VTIEQVKIGDVAAKVMEKLEEKYEQDETAKITSVFVLVAVDHNGSERTEVHYAVSPGMATHEVVGMLEQIKHHLLS
jgi:hypothetical protein